MWRGVSRSIIRQLQGAQALLEEGLCVSVTRGAQSKPKEQSGVWVGHEVGLVVGTGGGEGSPVSPPPLSISSLG